MREIKFRGKRVDNGEWIYGDYFQSFCENKAYINSTNCLEMNKLDFVEIDYGTVGQFTGKIDSNKKEIYQGDIADVTIFNNYEDTSQKYRMIVEFYEGSWVFYKSVDDTLDLYWVCFSDNNYKVEIIGNIHDNPELLK